jgi:hypothetical protein
MERIEIMSVESASGLWFLLWGLAVLALCIPVVTNFRGYAEWLARKNRAFNKTHRQAALYHRGGSAAFGVLGIGAIVVGVVRIAHGDF